MKLVFTSLSAYIHIIYYYIIIKKLYHSCFTKTNQLNQYKNI